ncbi:FtsW/RodA/SpoVE family cell cycle protein [Paenibacillus daejeonensis]|uniref:FtsW/RodA/SpoVE family cell cycle protein n=1 Tax=Paenibacillus daejeonensis TaxID=135193 RepID=UPI00037C3261|nr:FtsW/RodA/SpoVE family cell cycle protein [Paenibacillus daejeonensis]
MHLLSKLKKLDWGILLLLGLFAVISFMAVRSATFNDPGFNNFEFKQLNYFIAGFAVIIVSVFFDYRILLRFWYVPYVIGLLLLVAVMFTEPINGARSWFVIGGFQLQPAELVKLTIIMAIAVIMNRRQGETLQLTQDIIPIFIVSFVPFLLVMIQPDLGNAIIYVAIVLGMLWIGNVKYLHVLISIVIVVGSVMAFSTLFNTFNDEIKGYLSEKNRLHWYQRINTFVNPEQASSDERYQLERAMIAIGSGGLTGDGYMQGDSKNGRFVPYPYSDSIFVVIGEEFGFQGSAVLLLLYFFLIYRMIIIAFQCYDRRGSFIIIGIVSMFVFQIFENIGMMIGIMPITGITLPFVSYGGTSLLLNMLCIGLVFSIRAHQEKENPEQA